MSFLAVPGVRGRAAARDRPGPERLAAEGDLSLWLMRVLTSGVLFLVSVSSSGGSPRARAGHRRRDGGDLRHGHARRAARADALRARRGRRVRDRGVRARPARRRPAGSRSRPGSAPGLAVLFEYSTGLDRAWPLASLLRSALRARASAGSLLGGLPAGCGARRLRLGRVRLAVPSLVPLRRGRARRAAARGVLRDRPADAVRPARGALRRPRAARLLARPRRSSGRPRADVAARLPRRGAGCCGRSPSTFLALGRGLLPARTAAARPAPASSQPRLPFLVLGLPFALARFRRTSLTLALVSVVLTTADAVTWGVRKETDRWYPGHGVSDLRRPSGSGSASTASSAPGSCSSARSPRSALAWAGSRARFAAGARMTP